MNKIRVGTRGSKLAVRQTEQILQLLKERCPDCEFEVIHIKTQGDKILDVPLAKIDDKGLFIKELEIALLDKRIDLAVHSMKDVPTALEDGLCIGAVTSRTNPRDVLVSLEGKKLMELPPGAVVGTSSLRRKAQILHQRPDLKLDDLRGNIDTRLKKLKEKQYDAIVLAAAGLIRLGWADSVTEELDYSLCLPAPGQGALGLEIRENDEKTKEIILNIHDHNTALCVEAERSLLGTLEGGCQVPVAAAARIEDNKIFLEAMVASLDGTVVVRESISSGIDEARETGRRLAELLKSRGAEKILQEIRNGRR